MRNSSTIPGSISILFYTCSPYEDIPAEGTIVGLDKYQVKFLSSMPTSHQARFSLTIGDSKGRIFTESFYLTEGDYLPGNRSVVRNDNQPNNPHLICKNSRH